MFYSTTATMIVLHTIRLECMPHAHMHSMEYFLPWEESSLERARAHCMKKMNVATSGLALLWLAVFVLQCLGKRKYTICSLVCRDYCAIVMSIQVAQMLVASQMGSQRS